MYKKLIVIALGVVLLGALGIILYQKFQTPKKVHYHAGFVVFQNNKKLDFSDFKYMYEKPCVVNGKEVESEANDQLEKAHLHDNVGDVIHIERDGATWGDLFTNIHFPVNYSQISAYINGKQIRNFQRQAIHPDDSLVLFIGKNDQKLLSQAVTKQYLDIMAKKSITCGD